MAGHGSCNATGQEGSRMGKAFESGELAARVFWIVVVGILLEVAAMLLITA
jgi:hypothetical protein